MERVKVDDVDAEVAKDRRRLMLLMVAPELLFGALMGAKRAPGRPGEWIGWTSEGVPADALVDGVWYDPERGCFVLRLWHRSFAPVDACTTVPATSVSCLRKQFREVGS